MENIDYTLLESIKDGEAVLGKYNTMMLMFTTPNVIIVFLNNNPDTRTLSDDRWLIFKINAGMGLEEVSLAGIKNRKREEGYVNKNRYNGQNQKTSNKTDYDSE